MCGELFFGAAYPAGLCLAWADALREWADRAMSNFLEQDAVGSGWRQEEAGEEA